MEKSQIINFSKFFGENSNQSKGFDKSDFKDFFINENIDWDQKEEGLEDQTHFDEISDSEKEITEIEEDLLVDVDHIQNFYTLYKDKPHDFSCDISLEGADLDNTTARLIIQSDEWNLVFFGQIDSKGKCIIPMKKLTILPEGIRGKIKLEVIADENLFTPWEEDFIVKLSKKVSVKIHESKSNKSSQNTPKKSGIKVNVRK